MIASKTQSHTLLFSSDPIIPTEVPIAPSPPDGVDARRAAQIKFVEFLKNGNRASPLLLARFIARQVGAELQKMVEATTPGAKKNILAENDFTDSEGANHGYGLGDHMERLRYLEIVPNKEEVTLLSNVLQTALPGLEGFVLEERHAILSGKVTYNAFGVCYGGGRDDKVCCRLSFTLLFKLTFFFLSLYSQCPYAVLRMLRRLGHRMVLNVRLEVPCTQSPHT